MALVPEPLLPPVPVEKLPVGKPPRGLPFRSSPLTNQVMVVFAGKPVTGVQVNTVVPMFHDGVVRMGLKVWSKKIASVASGFIGALNWKTTVVMVETPVAPLAGTVETMMVCALAHCEPLKAATHAISAARRLMEEVPSEFITSIQLPVGKVVTRKVGHLPPTTMPCLRRCDVGRRPALRMRP